MAVLELIALVILAVAFMVVVIAILSRRSKEVFRARRVRIQQRKQLNPPNVIPDPSFQFDEPKQD